MAVAPRDGKLIYHLTSINNIESILKNGLLPRKTLLEFDDIADKEIVEHREKFNLDSYVPFHFFIANPFDGVVQKSNRNKKFIFITVLRSFAQVNGFNILTRHPLSSNCSELLSYNEGVLAIDWDKMAERDYTDNECKEICMAECLSPTSISPKDFFCIYVPDYDTHSYVTQLQKKFSIENTFQISVLTNAFAK